MNRIVSKPKAINIQKAKPIAFKLGNRLNPLIELRKRFSN